MTNKDKVKEQLPDWFDGEVYDEGDKVRNPFTGNSCELDAAELSMYNLVKAAEMVLKMGIDHNDECKETINDGKAWFKTKNKDAYIKLLDETEENTTPPFESDTRTDDEKTADWNRRNAEKTGTTATYNPETDTYVSDNPSDTDENKKKYINLFESLNLTDLKKVNMESDFSNKNLEYYFQVQIFREYGVYQLKKSDENSNKEVISKWSDGYIKDGNDDPDLKNHFDETNEVHHNQYSELWLFKFSSNDFNTILHNKINEFKRDEETIESIADGYTPYFWDFMEWLDPDEDLSCAAPEEAPTVFIQLLTKEKGKDYYEMSKEAVSIEWIAEDDIDYDGNIIEWGSFLETNESSMDLLYREKAT